MNKKYSKGYGAAVKQLTDLCLNTDLHSPTRSVPAQICLPQTRNKKKSLKSPNCWQTVKTIRVTCFLTHRNNNRNVHYCRHGSPSMGSKVNSVYIPIPTIGGQYFPHAVKFFRITISLMFHSQNDVSAPTFPTYLQYV
jgi:hypothetical protein